MDHLAHYETYQENKTCENKTYKENVWRETLYMLPMRTEFV